MTRRVLPPVAFGLLVAALAVPASAGPKPIEKKFDVTIPAPMLGSTGSISVGCAAGPADSAASTHREKFTAPGTGTLKVEVTGFVGDWDIALDAAGKRVAEGDNASSVDGNPSTGTTVEKLTFKVKKAGPLEIIVCNFVGGPSGKGKYTFTPTK